MISFADDARLRGYLLADRFHILLKLIQGPSHPGQVRAALEIIDEIERILISHTVSFVSY